MPSTSSVSEVLVDYDELVKNYCDGLFNRLRNFTPGPAFLDTWVHDEDHGRSLYGVFEAALDGGVQKITLTVSDEVSQTVNWDEFREQVSALGSVEVRKSGEKTLVEMSFAKAGDPWDVHACYRKAVERALKSIRHEGELAASTKGVKLSAKKNDVTLSLEMSTNGIVVSARHLGAKGATRAILDELCAHSIGKPLREVSEHGLIYLEYQMREFDVPHEVKGLLTPQNADPAFASAVDLSREIFKQYRDHVGIETHKNFWRPEPRQPWVNLSELERHKRTQGALLEIVSDLGIGDAKLDLVEILNQTRIVLSAAEPEGKRILANHLMTIERLLKEKLEPQVELVLESLEDRNKRIGRTQITRSTDATV